MAVENGPRNQPRFELGDDSDFAADLTAVADYAASVGTRMVGTTTERNAVPNKYLGLEFYDTTLKKLLRHNGTDWVTVGPRMAKYGGVGLYNNSGGVQPFLPGFSLAATDTVDNDFSSPYTGTNSGEDISGVLVKAGMYVGSLRYAGGNTVIAGARNIGLLYLRRDKTGAREEIARASVGVGDDSGFAPFLFVVASDSVLSTAHIVQVTGSQPTTVRHSLTIAKLG